MDRNKILDTFDKCIKELDNIALEVFIIDECENYGIK